MRDNFLLLDQPAQKLARPIGGVRGKPPWFQIEALDYFAGLDVSMEETHVCVIDREGKVILEVRTPTVPKAIAAALVKGPALERVLFEMGRIAPSSFMA